MHRSKKQRGWPLAGLVLFSLAATLGFHSEARAQNPCVIPYAWTASESDNVLRRIALDGVVVEESITITVPGQTVTGITGVAIHPATGELWFLAYFASNPNNPFLMRYDWVDQVTEVIGSTFVNFIALEFLPDLTIRAVSADTASPINSFCLLSQLTGAPTDICLYGNGDDGEAIGHHPVEDRMYHASGRLNLVFEAESPTGAVPCVVDQITPDPQLVGSEVTGISFVPSLDAFLWSQDGAATSDLYFVTTTGVATFVGTANHTISDIAVFELATPCPAPPFFVRGDTNGDMSVNIADAIFLLGQLFVPGAGSTLCDDTTDANDDSQVNIADAVSILNGLFSPGAAPLPAPFPDCGEDPTPDAIPCFDYICP